MSTHAKPVAHPHLAELVDPLGWAVAELVDHLLGVLAVLVALLLTAGGVLLLVSWGLMFPAVMAGVIGLLLVAICITYWMGEPR